MEKPLAALEITSKAIRLVVGYVLDGKVYVIYAMNKPIGPYMQNGTIVDFDGLIKELKSITEISDPNAKLKLKIGDVMLCLPPCGLEVFQTEKIVNVVGVDGKIHNQDIDNLLAQIKNEILPTDNEFIGTIPESYTLDHNRTFKDVPLDVKCSLLKMSAKVHALPHHIKHDLLKACANAGLSIRSCIVSTFAASQLLASYDDMPSDYFLVDIGAKMTTVSFVAQKMLYGSTFFGWGGDNITESIQQEFKIQASDAEKYKIMYGYDHREMNFAPIVCTTRDEEGKLTKHLVSDMSKLIKAELENFTLKLKSAISELLQGYEDNYKTLPIVMIGGGSQLKGLKDFVAPKVDNEKIILARPQSLGARDPSYFNCLGLFKSYNEYKSIKEESLTNITQVNRVNVK